jgi:hypothetical protein
MHIDNGVGMADNDRFRRIGTYSLTGRRQKRAESKKSKERTSGHNERNLAEVSPERDCIFGVTEIPAPMCIQNGKPVDGHLCQNTWLILSSI